MSPITVDRLEFAWPWLLLCGLALAVAYRRSSSSGIPGAPLVGFDVKDPKERKSQYTMNATGIIQKGYDRVRDVNYPYVDGTNERVSVQKSNLWRRHCRWYVPLLFLKVKAICLEF